MKMLIARILVASLFAMSLFGKFTAFDGKAAYAASSWIPLSGELLIIAAILMELFGVIALLSGWKFKEGALVLAFYTFMTIVMFNIGDGKLMGALNHGAIVGGLIAMSMLPAGKFSCFNK